MTKFPDDSVVDARLAKKIYYIFLCFSIIWLLLIFITPLFSSMGGKFEKISSVLYLFFSNVCHQEDDRSFHFFGHTLSVCSRCIWIYLGFFAGTALYPLKFRLNNTTPVSVWYLVIPVTVLLLDVFLDSLEVFSNTFFTRSVTGFLIGIVLPLYLIPGFVKFFYEIDSYLRNKVSI
ncbi:MAG: DUF2085 domain-containing protein [Bacteroidota bacterium]|nr:DUF2085 domain-containing protein [Bacteroidota bacterium]